MKESAPLILLTLTLGSCASIFNSSTTKIKVYTDKPTPLIVNEKTYQVNDKFKIKVKRQNEPLTLVVSSDTVKKEFLLRQKNSFNYYANVLTCGLGFIWDKGDKRYTYQKNIYVDPHSTNKQPDKFLPTYKKQSNLVLSLPWVNSFYLQPQGESPKANTGFWGISVGLNKYYKPKKYINTSVSAVMDLFVPVPAAVDISGEYELMSSVYLSLTDNSQFKNASIGYGINYSKNTWDFQYHDRFDPPPPTRDPVKKSSQAIGLIVNGHYRLTEHFHIGLIYRPNLLTVYPTTEFKYEHLISLDLAWKLRLIK